MGDGNFQAMGFNQLATLPGIVTAATNGENMKKKLFAGFVLMVAMGYAVASCPPYSPYRCVAGPNGKQLCGCGY